MTTWVSGIHAITVFAPDLAAAKSFYLDVFELPVHFEDDVSCVFDFGGVLLNLLAENEAEGLIGPARVADAASGARLQFTIAVDDTDATAARVVANGAALVNGPIDRPWGIRTAMFADPTGQLWEIAGPLRA